MDEIINGMTYTRGEVNKEWLIKVSGQSEGIKYNTLVGVSGLVKLLGCDLADRLICRAMRYMNDREICKLRRGLKITFYAH